MAPNLYELETVRRVKTLRRKLELTLRWKSVPLRRSQTQAESRQVHRLRSVANAAEPNSISDKRVHIEVCENEADVKITNVKWVLQPQKARCVLRGFEEDVQTKTCSSAR